MNAKKLLVYRSSFLISFVVLSMWVLTYTSLIEVIFYHTDSLAGFGKGEVLLIMAFYYLLQNISEIFFKGNIEDFGDTVRRGELDFILVKPAPSRLLAFSWEIRFDHLAGLIPTILLFSYALAEIKNPVSPEFIAFGLLAVAASVVIYYSILGMIATLIFWIHRSEGTGPLIFHISQLSRYPRSLYRGGFEKFITYGIPLALLASMPAEITLARFDGNLVGYFLFIMVIFYFLGRIFWHYGLKRYSSAN